MKKSKQTESSIMKGIMQALSFKGWQIFRMPPAIYAKAGIPDLIAIKQGMHVWIEVKREDGKLSPAQERYIQLLSEAGAEVIVARSVDYAVSKCEAIINNLKFLKGGE